LTKSTLAEPSGLDVKDNHIAALRSSDMELSKKSVLDTESYPPMIHQREINIFYKRGKEELFKTTRYI
jgi:hypothetical protein